MFRVLLVAVTVLFPLVAQRNVPVDNEHVRVVVVNDTSTAKGRLHEHPMNRVMIYLDRGHQRLEYSDGRVVDLRFNPGDALWSASGGMHTSQNVGGSPYRVVEVELKNKGGEFKYSPIDSHKVSPANYKVLIENPQVRVSRGRIGAKESVAMHEHSLGRVVVFLNDAQVRITPKEGAPVEAAVKAGEVRWAGPAVHREENLRDEPIEVISVEVKP
jgi:uncharacterized RmlC-like cupin family protein